MAEKVEPGLGWPNGGEGGGIEERHNIKNATGIVACSGLRVAGGMGKSKIKIPAASRLKGMLRPEKRTATDVFPSHTLFCHPHHSVARPRLNQRVNRFAPLATRPALDRT
jgi:hypothetical protein